MKKILIVDDALFMRTVLKDILARDEEYSIVEADSGKSALAQFQKEQPDLILLDIIMPEGEEEGVRVLSEVIRTTPDARIIMITAVGQEMIVEKCKNLGARDYIVKPFDDKQVLETVKRCLE